MNLELVIDANILFAALIRKGISSELLLHEELHLYAPEFILEEFEKYRELVKKKSHIDNPLFNELLRIYNEKIQFVPMEEISDFIMLAQDVTPDIKDVPYIALAMLLRIPIWSNDQDLKDKQNSVMVYQTKDLIEFFIT
jgi:predicted nucleic acid-binding protein